MQADEKTLEPEAAIGHSSRASGRESVFVTEGTGCLRAWMSSANANIQNHTNVILGGGFAAAGTMLGGWSSDSGDRSHGSGSSW
jgi:hypothetical protein